MCTRRRRQALGCGKTKSPARRKRLSLVNYSIKISITFVNQLARSCVAAVLLVGLCKMPASLASVACVASIATNIAQAVTFNYQVQLGVPTYVLNPNATGQPSFPDQSTIVLNFTDEGVLRGYNAFKYTQIIIEGSSLASVPTTFPNVSIDWDIEAALVDPENETNVHAYMHREHGWMVNGDYFYHGYITYQLSTDSGHEFRPWPNAGNFNDSFIIASAGPWRENTPANSGTGPHWSVVNGDYIYLYYQDNYAINATGQPCIANVVARSLLSDRGRPGTWTKYFNGGWTEPGMGGNASALPGLAGAKMVWMSKAQVWLAVGYSGALSVSNDGLEWLELPSTLIPPQGPTSNRSDYFQFPNWYYYTSLIPGYGGTTFYENEDSLWLYYLFTPAGNVSWAHVSRGLASVQLTLIPQNSSAGDARTQLKGTAAPTVPQPFILPSLSQWVLHTNSSDEDAQSGSSSNNNLQGKEKDSWATISPTDMRVYDYGWHIGYVFASPADWTLSPLQPIFDCYFVETNDHFVARAGECVSDSVTADTDAPSTGLLPAAAAYRSKHGSGLSAAYLGTMGYLLSSNATAVPGYELIALWRCYDEADEDHYIAPVYGCQATDKYPALLGYALWQND